MNVVLIVASYVVAYVVLRLAHVNGNLGTACAILAAVVMCLVRSQAKMFKPLITFSLAIAIAASAVLSISRLLGDIGRGEDTATFIFIVATYWMAGSVLFALVTLARKAIIRRRNQPHSASGRQL